MKNTDLNVAKNEFKQKTFKINSSIATLLSMGVLLLLLCAIFWPLAFIWALNTLFGFTIQYTFWNWLACWILIFTFQGAINIKREKAK